MEMTFGFGLLTIKANCCDDGTAVITDDEFVFLVEKQSERRVHNLLTLKKEWITIFIHGATGGVGKKIAGVPITVQGWSQSAYPKSSTIQQSVFSLNALGRSNVVVPEYPTGVTHYTGSSWVNGVATSKLSQVARINWQQQH